MLTNKGSSAAHLREPSVGNSCKRPMLGYDEDRNLRNLKTFTSSIDLKFTGQTSLVYFSTTDCQWNKSVRWDAQKNRMDRHSPVTTQFQGS